MFTFFPAPADGETVYSLVSRYHLMSGYPSFRFNTMAMLGVLHGRASNEFPCFLPQLSLAADIPLATVIQSMTPYSYYAPFLPEKLSDLLRECLSNGQTRNLQSTLGTLANRMTPGGFLFSCRHCIKEDVEMYGFPFWHLIHQLTGIVACPRHHEILHAIPRIKSQAILPELIGERDATDMEWRYATLIQSMHSQQNIVPLKDQCLITYGRRLFEMGMLTEKRRIRSRQLRELIANRLKGIKSGGPAFDYLQQQLLKEKYPDCLFYGKNFNHHPLKHLVLIEALFESWSEFISEVTRVDVIQEVPHKMPSKKSSPDHSYKAQCMLRSGQSLRTISKNLAISVATLKIIAGKAGIPVSYRPTKIFSTTERKIWILLLLGIKTSEIAPRFDISVGAVEQILRKHPKISILRKRIRFYQRQRFHRDVILNHMKRNPFDSRKLIRQALGATYMWLYRHDKDWFDKNLPPEIPRTQRYSRSNTKG